MALFTSDKKLVLGKLRNHDWSSEAQLQELLERLMSFELRLDDVLWMATDPNRTLRHYGGQIIIQGDFPNTLATLLRAAQSMQGAARKQLVALLPRLREDFSVARVDAWLRDRDPEKQKLAVDIVLSYPPGHVMPQLTALLQAADSDTRKRAAQRLLEEPDPRTRPLLLPLLSDPDERIRLTVVQGLGKTPDDAVLDALIDRLRVDGLVVRQGVLRVLRELIERGVPGVEDRVIPLLAEGEESVRAAVIQLVVHMRDRAAAVRKIILFSGSLMGWMRERIHRTVKEAGEPLIDVVVELMLHKDQEIRRSALLFSTHFTSPRMVEPVIRMLSDGDWWIRVVAIDLLGRLGDERAVDPLIAALDDDEIRWSAVEALSRIGSPRALKPIARLLGDPVASVRLEVVRAIEVYDDPRALPLLMKVIRGDPEIELRERALQAYKAITHRHQMAVDEAELREAVGYDTRSGRQLDRLLAETRRIGGSDFHLSIDSLPTVRLDGELRRIGKRAFAAADTERTILEVLTPAQRALFEREHQIDFCYEVQGVGRYRANVYRERLGVGGVFRVIPNEVPSIIDLRLPPHLADITSYNQGLVIVGGPAGCGKTTTLAALVNLLNETWRGHIITLEDPIELIHPFKGCLVNQREVGRHTQSFSAALRSALREDPDAIVVGELRDLETMALALTAAETGHLVIATMHTTSARKTVDRLIDAFPPREQGQVRAMLAESLKVVITQSLVPRKDRQGRVACFEVLMVTHAVSNLIRDQKTHQLASVMQIGRAAGMSTVDQSLLELVQAGAISAEDAYLRATKKEDFEPLVSKGFLEGSHAD
ncbi:MAG: hypothetical protein AMXMBFR64_51700 [Myxococcales bacterium]